MKVDYLHHTVRLGDGATIEPGAAVVGRLVAGPRLTLRAFATLRADGESITVGRDGWFGERASVHIVDGILSTTIGDDVTVGRFGLVHACTVGDGCVIGEGAAVLDGASVGAGAVLAADSFVAPRKQLQGGWVYAGAPARPVREVTRGEARELAESVRTGRPDALLASRALPPLDMAPFLPPGHAWDVGASPFFEWEGRSPQRSRTYVAPTAVLVGDIVLADDAGVYFGCALAARGARIVIGAGTNIQDNSLLETSATRGDLVIGEGVTVGHNVRLGSGRIHDDALVGMASQVGDGVVVEQGACVAAGAVVAAGTVVREGWLWAGRPARAFRRVSPEERAQFARGRDVYIGYSAAYLQPGG